MDAGALTAAWRHPTPFFSSLLEHPRPGEQVDRERARQASAQRVVAQEILAPPRQLRLPGQVGLLPARDHAIRGSGLASVKAPHDRDAALGRSRSPTSSSMAGPEPPDDGAESVSRNPPGMSAPNATSATPSRSFRYPSRVAMARCAASGIASVSRYAVRRAFCLRLVGAFARDRERRGEHFRIDAEELRQRGLPRRRSRHAQARVQVVDAHLSPSERKHAVAEVAPQHDLLEKQGVRTEGLAPERRERLVGHRRAVDLDLARRLRRPLEEGDPEAARRLRQPPSRPGSSRKDPPARAGSPAAESRRPRSPPPPPFRPGGPRDRSRCGRGRAVFATGSRAQTEAPETRRPAQSRCHPSRSRGALPRRRPEFAVSAPDPQARAWRTIFDAFSKGTFALKRANSASRNPEPGSARERSSASRTSSAGITVPTTARPCPSTGTARPR